MAHYAPHARATVSAVLYSRIGCNWVSRILLGGSITCFPCKCSRYWPDVDLTLVGSWQWERERVDLNRQSKALDYVVDKKDT